MYCWQHAERPPHICGTSWPEIPRPDDSVHRGKVVDLVDPYRVIDSNSQGGKPADAPPALVSWLQSHPGRWAMTAQDGVGTSDSIMDRLGYETARRDHGARHFARLRHPEGETLHEALQRSKSIFDVLPEVERDPFNWSPAELDEAVQCARDNLFPVSDTKAA